MEEKTLSQLLNSYNAKRNMEEAFQKGFHFHWIAYSHSVLTEFVKSFILLDFNWKSSLGKIEKSLDFKEYVTSMNFRSSISLLHFNGIINLELYNKLKEINSKRNLVLHNLIFKNEKVNQINLEQYFNLCDNSIKMLVNEMASWANFHLAIQGDLIKMFEDFEKRLNEDRLENEKK